MLVAPLRSKPARVVDYASQAYVDQQAQDLSPPHVFHCKTTGRITQPDSHYHP